jgi:hypothetical protein
VLVAEASGTAELVPIPEDWMTEFRQALAAR